MVRRISLKTLSALTPLILSLLILSGHRFPIQPVTAISNSYTDSFDTKTYLDTGNTTTEGWGSGTVSLSRKSPIYSGAIDTTNATGICITRYYVYLADQESGLLVMNITDPSSPTLVGSYNTPGLAKNVFFLK